MACLSPSGLYNLLSVLDSAIALLAVFPFTCMYFRGIWDLIGHYILPGQAPLQYWVYLGVGQLQIVGLMILPYVDSYLDRSNKTKFWILSRLFMYIYTIPYMFYWHGLWLIMNHYFGTDWQWSSVTLVFTWTIMCFLGSCRSCMWPPFFIAMDDHPESLVLVSRFKTKFQKGHDNKDYVSDAYLSQLIILGLSICCWRSTFNIIDNLLTPDDPLLADIISAVVGLVGCTIMLCLQWPLGKISSKLSENNNGFLRLIWEDTVYAVTFGVLAFLWRGVWNLNCRYLVPQMPLGAWVNFVVGSVALLAMQTFTEVCNLGISDDGNDPGGEAFYPVQYLRVYFQKQCQPEKNQSLSEKEEVKKEPEYGLVPQKDPNYCNGIRV